MDKFNTISADTESQNDSKLGKNLPTADANIAQKMNGTRFGIDPIKLSPNRYDGESSSSSPTINHRDDLNLMTQLQKGADNPTFQSQDEHPTTNNVNKLTDLSSSHLTTSNTDHKPSDHSFLNASFQKDTPEDDISPLPLPSAFRRGKNKNKGITYSDDDNIIRGKKNVQLHSKINDNNHIEGNEINISDNEDSKDDIEDRGFIDEDRKNYFRKKISTYETLPSAQHYKNIFSDDNVKTGGRPSLSELHGDISLVEEEYGTMGKEEEKEIGDIESEKEMGISQGPKFGWIKGVVVRCLLNIWGVMLFLRLSWVVGQAGIGLSTLIIIISMIVIIITAMSMAAICTNGEIKGGGAYYMLSRSLGPEFGGAIGIIFSLANAVSVSMNVVGLAETIVDMMQHYGGTTYGISTSNWIRIIGCSVTVLLLGVVMAGLEWETKTQLVFLVLLLLSFVNYFVGTVIPPTPYKKSRGVMGYKGAIFKENFGPSFKGETFFSVFAIFFPSFTGFLAGCNISGDLKNAQTAIPKGTFWAIFITSFSYLLMVWTFGASVIRDASGILSDLYLNSNPNNSMLSVSELIKPTSALRECLPGRDCKFGLRNDYQTAELQSAFGPIITLGIFAACLSSAIASLEGSAKVFQALSRDRLFPILSFFAVGTKKHGEPFRAYFLMFFIAILFILMANLNILAPIISNFFLMSFALINYSCFDVYMSGSIGFRPGYSYYNHWISLIGGVMCIITMFLIKWWATLLTFFFVFFFYGYVHYKKPDVNWGSSSQAHVYKSALAWVMKLNQTEEHVKNFRPQILVLTGDPRSRPTLLDFVNYFTKNLSLLICGYVMIENTPDYTNPPKLKEIYEFLDKRKVKALYDNIRAPNLRQGAFGLLEVAGLGRLKPNILMMGYMSNWRDEDLADVNNYFFIIHDAFDLRFGVGIFKMPEGLDFSFFTIPLSASSNRNNGQPGNRFNTPMNKRQTLSVMGKEFKQISGARKLFEKWGKNWRPKQKVSDRRISKDDLDIQNMEDGGAINPDIVTNDTTKTSNLFISNFDRAKRALTDRRNTRKQNGLGAMKKMSKKYSRNIMASINKFQYKQHKGSIDVWWLFDDGGLTILLPYILANRRHWEQCKIRFFALCNTKEEQEIVHTNFATLLQKFRIDYSDLIILSDIQKMPYPSSIQDFESIIEKYRVKDENDKNYSPGMITDAEYCSLLNKTHRQIRLHEMLTNYSLGSNLVVMTLPMPRKGSISSSMYMAWLEIISKNMPPFLFLRGNQQSVITFYS